MWWRQRRNTVHLGHMWAVCRGGTRRWHFLFVRQGIFRMCLLLLRPKPGFCASIHDPQRTSPSDVGEPVISCSSTWLTYAVLCIKKVFFIVCNTLLKVFVFKDLKTKIWKLFIIFVCSYFVVLWLVGLDISLKGALDKTTGFESCLMLCWVFQLQFGRWIKATLCDNGLFYDPGVSLQF